MPSLWRPWCKGQTAQLYPGLQRKHQFLSAQARRECPVCVSTSPGAAHLWESVLAAESCLIAPGKTSPNCSVGPLGIRGDGIPWPLDIGVQLGKCLVSFRPQVDNSWKVTLKITWYASKVSTQGRQASFQHRMETLIFRNLSSGYKSFWVKVCFLRLRSPGYIV